MAERLSPEDSRILAPESSPISQCADGDANPEPPELAERMERSLAELTEGLTA
jgi:hypothetical protein